MNIGWIVQRNLVNETEHGSLIYNLQRAEIPYCEIDFVPFSHEIQFNKRDQVERAKSFKKVITYGSDTFIQTVVNNHAVWWPGTFYNDFAFNYKTSLLNLGRKMLNADGCVLKLREALSVMSHDRELFIRPSSGLKLQTFAGTTVNGQDLKRWYESASNNGQLFDLDTEVIIAPAKHIAEEYRFFVVDRQIVTGCRYRKDGELSPMRRVPPDTIRRSQRLNRPKLASESKLCSGHS
jgi:hypothetical protein